MRGGRGGGERGREGKEGGGEGGERGRRGGRGKREEGVEWGPPKGKEEERGGVREECGSREGRKGAV